MMMSRHWMTMAAVVALSVVPACADDQGADEPAASVDSTTPVDTDTVAPGDESWDLVWYSDSSGFGVADKWADVIADKFDVEVRVHDHATGGLSAVDILWSLGTPPEGFVIESDLSRFGRLGDTRDDVADAEIVVVYGNPINSGSTDDLEQCVTTADAPRDPPTHYSEADFAPYEDVIDSIFAEIFELTDGRPVMVRAYDSYNPVIAPQEQAGVKAECIVAWEAWSASIGRAAARHDVPLVSMYDAFNGPDHDEDPRAKGYIGYDGQHTTGPGQDAMVQALDAAGYEPIG